MKNSKKVSNRHLNFTLKSRSIKGQDENPGGHPYLTVNGLFLPPKEKGKRKRGNCPS